MTLWQKYEKYEKINTELMQLPDENLYMHWYIFVCFIYSIFSSTTKIKLMQSLKWFLCCQALVPWPVVSNCDHWQGPAFVLAIGSAWQQVGMPT